LELGYLGLACGKYFVKREWEVVLNSEYVSLRMKLNTTGIDSDIGAGRRRRKPNNWKINPSRFPDGFIWSCNCNGESSKISFIDDVLSIGFNCDPEKCLSTLATYKSTMNVDSSIPLLFPCIG